MSAIRRTAALLGLVAAVIIGSSIPASAAYTARSVSVPSSIGTAAVSATTSVQVTTSCNTTTMFATVNWPRIADPRVSGYSISGNVNGTVISGQVGRTEQFVYSTGRVNAGYVVPVTVTITTRTDYGWTKASAPLTTTVTTC